MRLKPLSQILALALLALAPTLVQARSLTMGSCPLPDLGPLSTGPEDKLELVADDVDLQKDGISTLKGAVRLATGGREFIAPELKFDDANRIVTVNTPSRFRNAEYSLQSQSARYDFNSDSGVFTDTQFSIVAIGGRGTAKEFSIAKKGVADVRGAQFTTCGADSNAWSLTAGELHLDQKAGLGTVRNATLRLADIPVLYLPYLQYPIDGERHTGLLFPFVGSDNRVGVDVRTPIYLNLAPNYDAIVTPRLMSDRGVQLGIAGRYLLPKSEGRANFELLPHDRQFGSGRYLREFYHEGLINNRLAVQAGYADVSDRSYFEDLATRSAFTTLTHLERVARLTYHAPSSYTAQALVQDFQPLSRVVQGIDDPYRRLPEIRFDALTRNTYLGARLGGDAALTNFDRKDSVTGLRETLHPYLRFERDLGPVASAAQFDLLHTAYQLQNVNAGQSSNAQRTTPIVSLEASLPFEKVGSRTLQTLTPRVFYLYVPFRDQSSLPLFDTGEPDYDFPQLFVRNRFNGGDRIADANQLTTALTWRVLDGITGVSRISASLGQIYRFEESRVALPGQLLPNAGSSDYLADANVRISDRLSALATVNLSTELGQFNRNAIALRYHHNAAKGELAYRFRRGQLEQLDLSFSAPVVEQWRVAGRVRESLRDDRLLDSLLGVEYETCCWALRTSYRRTLVNSRGDFSSGIYLQLELKGLTRFGTGFDELLPGNNRSPEAP